MRQCIHVRERKYDGMRRYYYRIATLHLRDFASFYRCFVYIVYMCEKMSEIVGELEIMIRGCESAEYDVKEQNHNANVQDDNIVLTHRILELWHILLTL